MSERDFSTRRRKAPATASDRVLVALAAASLFAAAHAAATAYSSAREAEASLERTRGEIAHDSRRLAAHGGREGEGRMGRAVWSLTAPPARVVADLAPLLPDDVRVERLTLRYGSSLELNLTLSARTPMAYDRFVQALERSASFRDVVPGDETRGTPVQASVRARYAGADP